MILIDSISVNQLFLCDFHQLLRRSRLGDCGEELMRKMLYCHCSGAVFFHIHCHKYQLRFFHLKGVHFILADWKIFIVNTIFQLLYKRVPSLWVVAIYWSMTYLQPGCVSCWLVRVHVCVRTAPLIWALSVLATPLTWRLWAFVVPLVWALRASLPWAFQEFRASLMWAS